MGWTDGHGGGGGDEGAANGLGGDEEPGARSEGRFMSLTEVE